MLLFIEAIVFAIERTENGKNVVLLNPTKWRLNNIKKYQVHAYLICPDKRVADEISVIKPPKELVEYILNDK